jgi:hypothetical protein
LPIMVFGQTSAGNSEFDSGIFSISYSLTLCFSRSLYFCPPLLAKPSADAEICQEMQVVRQIQS